MKNKGLLRYYSILSGFVVLMLIVKWAMPSVARPSEPNDALVQTDSVKSTTAQYAELENVDDEEIVDSAIVDPLGRVHCHLSVPNAPKHKIYSVCSYDKAFPDLNDTQLIAARKNGIKPLATRSMADDAKSGLVYIGSSPYFDVDKMRSSIPFLVPKASRLLTDIAVAFQDSLALKHIPLHKLIVTSALRTNEDVEKLRRHNGNAVPESCHRYATTVDITYLNYNVVEDPDGPSRRKVSNDTLLYVLSEVLNDMRKANRCFVKHERKQSCYHITVR
ncbi:MAG: hypothetical protein IKR18_11130 [Bacteroidaceae bacterium]|nr:hypothetical protein [Bacteroidaceae bacterium]